jgi:hypothetical protein
MKKITQENGKNVILRWFSGLGRKCKIFINNNYVITGYVFSTDNFFNFLVYDSYISKNQKKNCSKFYSFRFIRGEHIIYIKFLD